MSVYDQKPQRFLKRLHKQDANPLLRVYCVGFEDKTWRCSQFAFHLAEWLPEYALPEEELRVDHGNVLLKLNQAAVRELFVLQKSGANVNYSLFLAELPRWFRAEALKILEEQGVPIQISERFLRSGDTVTTLGDRLRGAAVEESDALSKMERQWVLQALPR